MKDQMKSQFSEVNSEKYYSEYALKEIAFEIH